jgi:acetoin utilization deacetylase AcuC-like enzyme
MNPLEGLNDIAVPATVNYWPLAWGWWVTIGLVLAILVSSVVLLVRYQRQHAAKKTAIQILKLRYDSQRLTLSEANQVLKRMALSYCERNQVSSLHGQEWVEFLTEHVKPSKRKETWVEDLQYFADQHYRQQATVGVEDIYSVSLAWLKAADIKRLQAVAKEPVNV